MKQRKHVVFTLVIVMLAVIALSVNTVLAGSVGRDTPLPVDTPLPDEIHPPVCYKIDSFAPGMIGLECFDTGKDIIDVQVKTNAKYDLQWSESGVTLWVYPESRDTVAYWSVSDKAGSVTTGKLP